MKAEQVKTSYTPYVKVYLPDYNGGTDLSQYVKQIVTTEQCFGGSGYILLGDLSSWFIVGSEPIDLRGYRVDVSWGAWISGAADVSQQAPLWIWDTPLTSFEGELSVQLECIDIWQWLQLLRVMNTTATTAAPGYNLAADTDTYFAIFSALLTNLTTLTLDSTDGIIDVGYPKYQTQVNTPIATVFAENINHTNCYLRMRADNMHAGKLPDTSASKYTFDIATPGHYWKTNIMEDAIVAPNRVIAVDVVTTDENTAANYDEAVDARSVVYVKRAFSGHSGYITRVLEDENIDSSADALQLAEASLSAAQRSTSRGVLTAPMECGIELYDWVEVVDSRWP